MAADTPPRSSPEDELAYDGSNLPQKRQLEPDERSLLHRVIGLVADDFRWATTAVVRKPEIRAAVGDGTVPQARDLTARGRDDVCRMVMLLTGELHHEDVQGRGWPPAELAEHAEAELTRGEIARLNLIFGIIDPRDDAGQLVVNVADWAPPADVPRGSHIVCAPRPLEGDLTWRGEDHGHGQYYAAADFRSREGETGMSWGGSPAARASTRGRFMSAPTRR